VYNDAYLTKDRFCTEALSKQTPDSGLLWGHRTKYQWLQWLHTAGGRFNERSVDCSGRTDGHWCRRACYMTMTSIVHAARCLAGSTPRPTHDLASPSFAARQRFTNPRSPSPCPEPLCRRQRCLMRWTELVVNGQIASMHAGY